MSHVKLFIAYFAFAVIIGIIYLIINLNDFKKYIKKTDNENGCNKNEDDDDLFYKVKAIGVLKRKS